MAASIFMKKGMLTFEEFRDYLFECIYDFLDGFPEEEVRAYLESDAHELGEIEKEYQKCVERYRVSKLNNPNEVFAAGISRLVNLLTLCFE